MAYFRQRSMAGAYSQLDYPLPSNSLTAMPNAAAAVAVVKAVANAAQRGMSGAYGPTLPAQASPTAVAAVLRARARQGMSGGYYRRAGMGDVSSSLDDLKTWVTDNPALAGGIAIAAVMLLGVGRRRR